MTDELVNQTVPERRPDSRSITGKLLDKLESIKAKLPEMKVRWLDRAWSWMNGKKTFAGLGLMLAGGVACLFPGWQMLGQAVFYCGSGLAGIGVLHKAAKAQSLIGPSGEFGLKEWIELAIIILTAIASYLKRPSKAD